MEAIVAYVFAPLGIGICVILLGMGVAHGLVTWWKGRKKG